ncbi:MAG: glycerol-3-phosphate acyltransferase [Verrucomicrobiales bacterium]|nr:glycerol-3-phosphate acyltransferase [Verrucomicrobiales bacterium]
MGTLIGYFFGCFTTGYYLVRWRTGQDIREIGSGSCGARNVGRQLGKVGFFLTVLGDLAKGGAAVLLTRYLTDNETAVLWAMIGVVVGHIWPVQLGFRGGKGIAACMGALSFISFPLALSYCGLALFGRLIIHKSVLPGMIAFALLPALAYLMKFNSQFIAAISVLACIILTAHYRNVIQEINQLLSRHGKVEAQPKAESTK